MWIIGVRKKSGLVDFPGHYSIISVSFQPWKTSLEVGTLLQLFAMWCLSHLVEYRWVGCLVHGMEYFHDPFVEVI